MLVSAWRSRSAEQLVITLFSVKLSSSRDRGGSYGGCGADLRIETSIWTCTELKPNKNFVICNKIHPSNTTSAIRKYIRDKFIYFIYLFHIMYIEIRLSVRPQPSVVITPTVKSWTLPVPVVGQLSCHCICLLTYLRLFHRTVSRTHEPVYCIGKLCLHCGMRSGVSYLSFSLNSLMVQMVCASDMSSPANQKSRQIVLT